MIIVSRQEWENLLYSSTMLKTVLKCTDNGRIPYLEIPKKTVVGEISTKLIGIAKDVPTETTEQQFKNDLRSITVKQCQRKSQLLPATEPTIESESEYQLSVSHGMYISNMPFKVEHKNTKMKTSQSYNCQKGEIMFLKYANTNPSL